ncbi:ABC transporter permease [Brachybacterium sp. YJGR34]|uniref:ABC transporter permease n=1 Tax=Brachybacterium sp. YJGR34 TaxID=2059911 RepID=UPI000E0AD465|nr:ABC transporter permease [Brachybacterium sp. YJGR34]
MSTHGLRAPAPGGVGGSAHAAVRTVGALRLPEFVLFALLIMEGSWFSLPLPLNQVAMMGIIALAVTRRPQVRPVGMELLVPALAIGLFYLGMISMFTDTSEFASDWTRRLIRLALTSLLILVLASGRIDWRSGLAGLGTAMIGNAVAFYAGLAPDTYGGALSGFFEDKNVAGLTYSVIGVLMIGAVDRRWLKVALVITFAALVWLTGSRTSITAFAAGVLWLVAAPRLAVLGRIVLGLLIYFGVGLLAEDYARIGTFSDREGSDLLRHRIDAASQLKVEEAGFFGTGLGEAYVVFEDQPGRIWYFHNSFWTALVEGGWPWLLLVLGITVIVALRPLTRTLGSREIAAQAAAVALLICAWRLGEVLFTIQWALVIAFALYARARAEAPPGGSG